MSSRQVIKIYTLIVVFFWCYVAKAQRILVYDNPDTTFQAVNKIARLALAEKLIAANISLDFTNNPNDFNQDKLVDYQGVCFLNSDIDELNLIQASELQRYFKAGGGFVGIHQLKSENPRWLWFDKMIEGKLSTTQKNQSEPLNLITNLFIGKAKVPILWKINDKPFIYEKLPFECKPVIMDMGGHVLSWYNTTTFGNLLFYTALGGDTLAYQSADFLNHLTSAFEEIIQKTKIDYTKVIDDKLPLVTDFQLVSFVDTLQDATLLALNERKDALILQKNGEVFFYKNNEKVLHNCGFFPELANAQYINPDPEVMSNGYYYFYLPTGAENLLVLRYKLLDNFLLEPTNFSQQTSRVPQEFALNSTAYSTLSLPLYYRNKFFMLNEQGKLEVKTYDEEGKLLNLETFLHAKMYKDFKFSAEGELHLISENAYSILYFNQQKLIPIAYIQSLPKIINAGTEIAVSAFKVNQGMDDENQYSWWVNEQMESTDSEFKFTFKNAGIYALKLQVENALGLDIHEMQLEVFPKIKK